MDNEDLDFKNLKPCPHCEKPIPVNAAMCLYCGETVCTKHSKTWIVFVSVFIIVLFIFLIAAYF